MNESTAASPSILIVDDTPVNLQLLAGMLTDRGYRPRPVPSGKLALQAALAEPPDLVLLDINMPEMNGYQVCERFKGSEKLRDIPIIFLSALSETTNKVRGLQLGAVDYISKPFHIEEVEARVKAHLKIRSLQRALQEHNALLEQRVEERTRELSRAYEQLAVADRLKNDFLLMISHEMRTPSNGLFGICDLVFASADFPEHEQYRAMFEQSRARLLQLLDDVELLNDSANASAANESDDVPLASLIYEIGEALEGTELLAHPASEALLDRPLKGKMAWLLRALSTAARTAQAFLADRGAIRFNVGDDGACLHIEFPLDRLRLRENQAGEFFELASAVRTKSAAESLGLSPVVAHRILSRLGGSLSLVAGPNETGSLVARVPFAAL